MKTINGQCSSRLHGMSYWQAQHSCPLLCYEGAASRPSFEEESWEFDPVASVLVQKIMQLCGLDPETCTRSDLEAQEPFVICLLCANLNMTMGWEVSVRSSEPCLCTSTTFLTALHVVQWVHWRTMHEDRDAHESSWRLLKSEEASKFRRIWQGDGASSSGRSAHIRSRNKTRYECLLCINPALTPKSSSQRVPMDEPELRHHIASV
ncbi:hypothetical protein DL93DRAFT_1181922 [Clavulina sp. PMI_390]|nr:hypothetical protein DL93DRAFT_1181922 [Clavulina sp. PMI_390]